MATVITGTKERRNEPCSCGSGKKFKRCCGDGQEAGQDTAGRFFQLAAVLAGGMLVVGLVVSARALFFSGEDEARRVWSAEHGHWHTVGGAEGGEHASQEGGPGKVWSEEHGHFHDVGAPISAEAPKPVAGALEGLRASELDQARSKLDDGAN